MKKTKKVVDETKNTEEKRKLVSLETVSIICDKKYQLVKGEEVPKEIPRPFIDSLKKSNLIK